MLAESRSSILLSTTTIVVDDDCHDIGHAARFVPPIVGGENPWKRAADSRECPRSPLDPKRQRAISPKRAALSAEIRIGWCRSASQRASRSHGESSLAPPLFQAGVLLVLNGSGPERARNYPDDRPMSSHHPVSADRWHVELVAAPPRKYQGLISLCVQGPEVRGHGKNVGCQGLSGLGADTGQISC